MEQQIEIVLHGHLSPAWSKTFQGLQVTCREDGTTCIYGVIPDQTSLYGLLLQLRDFGMTLVSVKACGAGIKSKE